MSRKYQQPNNSWTELFIGIMAVLLITVGIVFPNGLEAQPKSENSIRLLVRGDDMGISHATNEALIQSYKQGIQKSVEVLVPSGWFPEAVHMINENPGIDVGIHLALTSEWNNLKWRPLTKSPSLTDSNGYFYPVIWPNEDYNESQSLKSQEWKLNEIEEEFRKQIEVGRANIHNLTHLSYHMGCHHIDPTVTKLVKQLAAEYGLDIHLDNHQVENIRIEGRDKPSSEKIAAFIKKLKNLNPGNYLFVGHPALDTPEMQAVHMKNYTNVAHDRQGITDLFTNSKVKKVIKELGIELISYSDLKKLISDE